MGRVHFKTPEPLDPSLIEIGDDIAVILPANKGLVTTVRGRVAGRTIVGSTRYYVTDEGATILAFDARLPKSVKVIVFSRESVPQETLFESEILSEIRERIA